jgi:hypothetical protein
VVELLQPFVFRRVTATAHTVSVHSSHDELTCFCFPTATSQPDWARAGKPRTPQAILCIGKRLYSLGLRRPGNEADHSLVISVETKDT